MTVQELYEKIDGSYDQAVSIMRMDKLIDKHIRRFGDSGVFESLQDAGETMDAKSLFEASHALKGISANLGLAKLSSAAKEESPHQFIHSRTKFVYKKDASVISGSCRDA